MITPGPEHRLLDAFVGKWKTGGTIKATESNPEIKIRGFDTYEWLPGGFFLLHKVDVYAGDDRNETTEIIGFDKTTKSYSMQHYDNKGDSGFMKANYNNGIWTFLGESLRFTGRFSQDGKILSGVWEQSGDGKNWLPYIDIRLVKES